MTLNKAEFKLLEKIDAGVEKIDAKVDKHIYASDKRYSNLERRVDCVETDVGVLKSKNGNGKRNSNGNLKRWGTAGTVVGTILVSILTKLEGMW